ncbi:MAG: LPP20 family lipoprotein [Planctomycetes bacterium]|nr:LPP20 family lipoprotein [Planctomycetota bacterium]
MRSLILCTACVLSLALVTGCGGEKRTEQPVISGVVMPDWFMEPGKDGNIGATGISEKSLGGMREQLKGAMAEGRTALANTISVKVQASFTRFFSEGGEKSWAEDGSIDKATIAQELSENVSRQLTNQIIQGSERKAMWEHPKSGDLYVWVVINAEKRDQVLTQVKAEARKQVAQRKKIHAELKTEDALKKLDAAINAEMLRAAGEVPPAG